VGSSIVRKLRSDGFENLVFSPFPAYDLRSQEQVMEFFSGNKPEYVFLAAAKVGGILANNTYPAEFLYDNLMIEANIIHAAYVHGVKKLLFLGSSCIYPKEAPQPLKEEYLLTGILEPTNEPYAIAKIAGIKLCDSYARQYGCNFISAMPTNLYGPNDNYDLEKSHVLPALIRKMHLGKCLQNGDWEMLRVDLNRRPVEGVNGTAAQEEILRVLTRYGVHPASGNLHPVTVTLWGTGNVYREFLHVDDLADALVFLMNHFDNPYTLSQRAEAGDPVAHVTFLNIGTGSDQTIRGIANLVKGVVGFKGDLEWDPSKPDGTFRKQLDVGLLNSLGWKEKIPLSDGIPEVYRNYLAGL